MPDTLIVGGGIAGLVAARELARAGHRVTVFEAGTVWGGQLSQHSVAGIGVTGISLDAGAESFATRGGVVAELLDELGLSADIVSPTGGSAWLYSAERGARPLPAASLFGIPSNPLARDVIASVGLLPALRAAVDQVMGARWRIAPSSAAAASNAVSTAQHSLGALVRGRMGNAILDRLVAPIVEGVYSKHPDDLAVSTISPGLLAAIAEHGSLSRAVGTLRAAAPAGSLVAGLAGGMHRLIDALLSELAALGVSLELNSRVSAVTPHSLQVNGITRDGLVVLATPGLLTPVVTTPVTLVTLVLEHPELSRNPRGSGVIVQRAVTNGAAPQPAAIVARALTHSTAKWAWLRAQVSPQEIVRLSYRSVNDEPESATAESATAEADLIDQARRDASAILGVTISPRQIVAAKVVHWARAERHAPPDGFVCVGDWVAGTGLASVIAHARTINELITTNVSAKGSA